MVLGIGLDLIRKTQKQCFSKCMLRHGIPRVFVFLCLLIFVRAMWSWCH